MSEDRLSTIHALKAESYLKAAGAVLKLDLEPTLEDALQQGDIDPRLQSYALLASAHVALAAHYLKESRG